MRKIAETIAAHGYEVIVICRDNRKHGNVDALPSNVRVFRFGDAQQRTLKTVQSWPVPFNPFWVWWIYSVARRERIAALIVTNLRLAIPALFSARLVGIPLIFDVAEYFAGMGQVRERTLPERLLKHPLLVAALERISVRAADLVWVVVEEQRERLLRMGISPERVFVVGNTPAIDEYWALQGAGSTQEPRPEELRLIYIGIITKGRGIDLVIKALACLRSWGRISPAVRLLVVGDGSYRRSLERLVRELGLEDWVLFVGWKSPREARELAAKSEVGVIPHVVSEFCSYTIPNKLFDYMLRGLPVLATPNRPVCRVLESTGCGIVTPEDPERLARILASLAANRAALREMGERGRRAVLERYNWAEDSRVLLGSLRAVMDRHSVNRSCSA